MKEFPVPNWSVLRREPIIPGLLISACLHLAILALVQPSPGSDMARTILINARLDPVAPRHAEVAPRQASTLPVAPPEPETRAAVMAIAATSPFSIPDLANPGANPTATSITATKTEPAPAPQTSQAAIAASNTGMGSVSPSGGPTEASNRPSLPLGIDTTWYSFRQVDTPPKALERIEPDYPEAARRRNQEGSVKLLLEIDDLGRVQSAEVIEAQPPGIFDEAALIAARKTRFQPAMKEGRPVRSRGYQRMRFGLED